MQAQKLEPTLRGGQDSTVTWEEQWTGGEGRQVQACRPAGEGRPWRQGSDRAQWGPYPPSFAATGHAGHSRPWPGHGPCLGSGDVQPSPGERDHCALQLPQPLPPLNLLGWALRRGGGGTPGWVGLPLPLPLRTPESRPPDGPRAGSQPPESRPRRSRVPLSILDGLTRCPLGPVCPFPQGWRLCPDLSTPQMPLGLSLAPLRPACDLVTFPEFSGLCCPLPSLLGASVPAVPGLSGLPTPWVLAPASGHLPACPSLLLSHWPSAVLRAGCWPLSREEKGPGLTRPRANAA